MGLDQLEQDFEKYRLQGVKLYTAEWNGSSRGYSLKDSFVAPYLEKCQRLGIRNIHIHKGPTTHPLDYDAYDVRDVCVVATDFPDLNFIIDHCGMPRIDDFCFVAGQEPNVYGGLALVASYIHARPKYFASMMSDLLFYVGPDRLLFGSDYAITSPKWIIEKFMEFEFDDETAREAGTQLTLDVKRKILGLNAAKLYGVDVPAEFAMAAAVSGVQADIAQGASLGGGAFGARDGSAGGDRRGSRPRNRRERRGIELHRRRRGRRRRGERFAAAADLLVSGQFRLSDGRRNAPRRAGAAVGARLRTQAGGSLRGGRDQPGDERRPGLCRGLPGACGGRSGCAAPEVRRQGVFDAAGCGGFDPAAQGDERRLIVEATADAVDRMAASDEELAAAWAVYREKWEAVGLALHAQGRIVVDLDGAPVAAADLADHLRRIRGVTTSASANGEMCRMLMAARSGVGVRGGAWGWRGWAAWSRPSSVGCRSDLMAGAAPHPPFGHLLPV